MFTCIFTRESYGDSVFVSWCLGVSLSRPGTVERPGEMKTSDFHHIYDSIESLVFCDKTLYAAGFRGPHERGGEKRAPTLKDVILPLLARLPWKWLQIDTDMLLIITSTGDELLRNVKIDDLEWPWTPKIRRFGEFFSRFWTAAHISRVNCAEMPGDRPRPPAYEIFSIERIF